jgi:hypothetical protein
MSVIKAVGSCSRSVILQKSILTSTPVTIIKIPRESAAQLVNWTSPVPGDEGNYITMLDVFHQLHCLNLIRRALYPERYNRTMWDGFQFQPISNHHVGTLSEFFI